MATDGAGPRVAPRNTGADPYSSKELARNPEATTWALGAACPHSPRRGLMALPKSQTTDARSVYVQCSSWTPLPPKPTQPLPEWERCAMMPLGPPIGA